MPKPFDEAIKLKGICRFCKPMLCGESKVFYDFTCLQAEIGIFNDFCTKEDYQRCTFNEVNLRSMPQSPVGKSVFDKTKAIEKNPPAGGPPVAKKQSPKLTPDEMEKLEFKTIGDFYTAIQRHLGKYRTEIDGFISRLPHKPGQKKYDLANAADRQSVWLKLIEQYARNAGENNA
jgi:hypothetical protein